jgi:hypothetical protein
MTGIAEFTMKGAPPASIGHCMKCWQPWEGRMPNSVGYEWDGVKPHHTFFVDPPGPGDSIDAMGKACFPLCETCWASIKPYERIPYYRRLWDLWMTWGGSDKKEWRAILRAVEQGK